MSGGWFMRAVLWLIVLFFAVVSPANAEWHEASTENFVVYADQSEKDVRLFADQLERFHAVMQYAYPKNRRTLSPSNRVTVFVVRNIDEVKKLHGGDNKYVAGFYQPRAGGSVAIVPRVDKEPGLSQGERVLLHEYTHHYMFGLTDRALPLWYTEGFAEFHSTAKFNKDGSVGIGLPAEHRALELVVAEDVSLDLLLDTTKYRARKSKFYDEFYGKSWLLFHYLTYAKDTSFAKGRVGQMGTFLTRYFSGLSDIEAAKQSFGDLKVLNSELNRYVKQQTASRTIFSAEKLSTGPIYVRKLSEGQAAMMPIQVVSKRGVTQKQALALLPKARAIAAKYPKDAAVMAALAEAEFDAGNVKEAIAAADAAIAADPKQINAHLQKGYAMAKIAKDTKATGKAWIDVRKQFVKVNGIEANHPVPLVHYYMTYKDQGAAPTKNAVDGLEWALELAPYDPGVRMMVAQQQLDEKRYVDAIVTLEPLAFSGHGSPLSKTAQEMLDKAKLDLDAANAAKEPQATAPK